MKHLLSVLILAALAFPLRAQDSLYAIVHVIYGSKPNAPGEAKWFGGKWGGHVGLEISPNKVVHFHPGGKVKAFRKHSPAGRYVVSTVANFYCTFDCDSSKRLQIKIPITAFDRHQLDSISAIYVAGAPYPYAFFGMRCAAACYHLLSHTALYPQLNENKMIRKFFYPRRLRKYLLREAKKQHWETHITPGRNTRKWDHD